MNTCGARIARHGSNSSSSSIPWHCYYHWHEHKPMVVAAAVVVVLGTVKSSEHHPQLETDQPTPLAKKHKQVTTTG